jgi:hypothetical protein
MRNEGKINIGHGTRRLTRGSHSHTANGGCPNRDVRPGEDILAQGHAEAGTLGNLDRAI